VSRKVPASIVISAFPNVSVIAQDFSSAAISLRILTVYLPYISHLNDVKCACVQLKGVKSNLKVGTRAPKEQGSIRVGCWRGFSLPIGEGMGSGAQRCALPIFRIFV